MNFLCDQCKQKYHVADEKLRGRSTTRFRCKKCGHVIELHLTALGGDDASADSIPTELSLAPQTFVPVPAPVAPSPAVARPAPPAAPAVARPLGSAARPAPSSGSLAAVARTDPAHAPGGAVGAPRPRPSSGTMAAVASTSRPGASPLRSALAPATAAAAAPVPAPSASPSSRPAHIVARAAPPPAPSASARPAPAVAVVPEFAWFAGIAGVPVGPLDQEALRVRIVTGEIDSATLVWREGLDDWRPIADVAELGALFAQAMAEATAAATVANVVPMHAPLTAPAVSAPVPTAAVTPAVDPVAARPAAVAAPATAALAGVDPFRAPPPAALPAAALVPPATAAPLAFSGSLSPSLAPSTSVAPPPRAVGGLPAAVWVLMAGVLAVGLLGGLVMARVRQPVAAAPVAAVVAPAPVAVAPSVGTQVQIPAEPVAAPAPVAVVAAPVAPAPGALAVAGTRRPAVAPVAGTRGRTPAITGASASPFMPAMDDGPGASGPRNMRLDLPQQNDDNNGPTGAARSTQVLGTLNRADVIGSCWNAALRRNPSHPREALTVTVDVTTAGRATRITVAGSTDPDLASCVQSRARALPYGSGGEVAAQANYNLAAGQ